ncbi:hypothetical protein EKM02_14475 [Flavobacterium sp. RSP49]|nr:ATP-binding protein [Flavobacterium sp. RSP49]RTY97006.1 hypothetical protein EKM02_14475 [Flavobacterium sp. RSP49]
MKMHIKSFYIDNFRGYRKFKLNCEKDLNVITGINNSGKTTILEAISLWNELFGYLISKAQKGNNKLLISQNDFRFSHKNGNYFDYRKFNSVRTSGYKDIFYDLKTSNKITISAIVENNTDKIEIGFVINAVTGNNYNIVLKEHDRFDFQKFNRIFNLLPNPIGCFFSSPIATLPTMEEFSLPPKIKEGVKTRQSVLFFRNRLFNLFQSANEFQIYKTMLSQIVFNDNNSIEFRIIGDIQIDINISIEVSIKQKGYKNISLLGSGTIQIMEILLHLFEVKKDLNVILLDEPDSHIHRDIQKRLIKELANSQIQFFITTHNEALIRSTNPKNIFFIEEDVSSKSLTEYHPIYNQTLTAKKSGISPSYHSHIMHKIGAETSLDILNALEADKIFFVEGCDDSDYIRKIMEINNINIDCVFWAFDGLDNLISKIKHYKVFFSGIGNISALWNKCSIIVDSDYTTDLQKGSLKEALKRKTGLSTFIWNTYTIESSILKDKNALSKILSTYTHSKGIIKTISEIDNVIAEKYAEYVLEKTAFMDNDILFCNSVQGQIDARKANLKSSLEISKVYNGTNLSNSYRIYCKGQFKTGLIDHICNKDDVEIILTKIVTELGIEIDSTIENRIYELIPFIDVNNQPNEWNDLAAFIKQI